MALFTITTQEQVNQPPSQVGDGSATTNYSVTYTFTRADFTTGTTPVYSDPEGDAASKLKITSLPATGELQNNGVAISTTPTTLDFVTVIDAGLFTYVPDDATTTQYNDTFNFEIADIGSGTFVG